MLRNSQRTARPGYAWLDHSGKLSSGVLLNTFKRYEFHRGTRAWGQGWLSRGGFWTATGVLLFCDIKPLYSDAQTPNMKNTENFNSFDVCNRQISEMTVHFVCKHLSRATFARRPCPVYPFFCFVYKWYDYFGRSINSSWLWTEARAFCILHDWNLRVVPVKRCLGGFFCVCVHSVWWKVWRENS